MYSRFYPADRVESYRASPHKARIDHVAQSLVRQCYLTAVVADHLREWLRFTTYLDARGLLLPTDVQTPEVETYVAKRLPHGSASRIRFVRASVRILIEADGQGHFHRRVRVAVRRPLGAWIEPIVSSHLAFLRQHRGLAERTLSKRAWQLARFAECLEQADVQTITGIRPRHIQKFLIRLAGQSSATRLTYGVTLRGFLRWAHAQGLVVADLSAVAVPTRQFRQANIRDVLTEDESQRILAVVDRHSAVGRRDYAVLMLAARYGLRPSDIRQLKPG